jgi:hypothetical protein
MKLTDEEVYKIRIKACNRVGRNINYTLNVLAGERSVLPEDANEESEFLTTTINIYGQMLHTLDDIRDHIEKLFNNEVTKNETL